VFPKKAQNIKANRKYAMSGTPMGGKPIKLFGALNYLHPNQFTSKWRWAEQWLDITKGYANHKEIGGIKKGREDDFYQSSHPSRSGGCGLKSLAAAASQAARRSLVRDDQEAARTSTTCSPSDAEIRIDEHHLSATSVLAEYTRLKQFANARCEIEIPRGHRERHGSGHEGQVPTFDSGKLPDLMERLVEQGIDPGRSFRHEPGHRGSQFREHVDDG
jgi:hypothetical protein